MRPVREPCGIVYDSAHIRHYHTACGEAKCKRRLELTHILTFSESIFESRVRSTCGPLVDLYNRWSGNRSLSGSNSEHQLIPENGRCYLRHSQIQLITDALAGVLCTSNKLGLRPVDSTSSPYSCIPVYSAPSSPPQITYTAAKRLHRNAW